MPISGRFQSGLLVTSGYSPVETVPDSITSNTTQMRRMNRVVLTNIPRQDIANAIWEGTWP